MKKGQIYQGVVREIRFPNRAITETESGEVCTVQNGLPGQKIEFRVNKARNGNFEGILLKVLEQSCLERDEPFCTHFGACGGCLYQTLPYEEQLKIKEQQIRSLLNRVCSDFTWEGIKKSPSVFAYRNKMEYTFGNEVMDGPLTLGLHRRGSFYDIVPVPQCRLVEEDFNRILSFTQEFFREKQVPFYHKMHHDGVLRNLVVRKAKKTGEIMVALVTTSALSTDLQEYVEGLLNLPKDGILASVLHIVNDGLADMVRADSIKLLYGREFIYEKLFDLTFKITPFSFFQTNTLAAEVLYETVRGYLGTLKDQEVYDLYSGTGTIAQVLAPAARKVIGVEIVEEAVEAARENAGMNGLSNCEFLCGDVLKVIDEIEEKPDVIVLDPPREGINPRALTKIIDFGVRRIVYISCKPTSLARDLEVFKEKGYELKKACSIDIFAGTQNMETVAVLEK